MEIIFEFRFNVCSYKIIPIMKYNSIREFVLMLLSIFVAIKAQLRQPNDKLHLFLHIHSQSPVFMPFLLCNAKPNPKRKSFSHIINSDIRVFPILYWISLISRIRWIQQESVEHDWRLLKAFLCLPLTVGKINYDSWLRISRLWVEIEEFLFLERKTLSNFKFKIGKT